MFSFFKKKIIQETTYMEVMCLHKHAQRFRDLGFIDEIIPPSHPVRNRMCGDPTYEQISELPTDIPYTALHKQFDDYESHFIACDGQRFVKVPGDRSGFIIRWNEETMEPDAKAMAKVREYFAVKKAAEARMEGLL